MPITWIHRESSQLQLYGVDLTSSGNHSDSWLLRSACVCVCLLHFLFTQRDDWIVASVSDLPDHICVPGLSSYVVELPTSMLNRGVDRVRAKGPISQSSTRAGARLVGINTSATCTMVQNGKIIPIQNLLRKTGSTANKKVLYCITLYCSCVTL